MKHAWMLVLVAVLATHCLAEDWTAALMTDQSTSKLEGRLGVQLDQTWEIGALATWWAEDEDTDWSVGGFCTMAIDPNATLPVADWLPVDLGLPDTLSAKTYAIGKVEVIPYEDDDVDLSASFGAGASIGPLCLEWLYRVVESGGADNPIVTSGPELWFGGRIEF